MATAREDWAIRAFEAADLPVLHAVRNAAYKPVFASFRSLLGAEISAVALARAEDEQGELLDAICAAGSAHTMLVVTVAGRVAGFVACRVHEGGEVGEVDLNAVHPDFAGQGLGTWMYERALDQLRQMGAKIATVGTGGDASHEPARRAYTKAGFGPSLPTVWMYRTL